MIRGERVELNLDSDGEDSGEVTHYPSQSAPFVADILERKPVAPQAPKLPTLRHTTGFPEHIKRRSQSSKFKLQKNASINSGATASSSTLPAGPAVTMSNDPTQTEVKSWEAEEKAHIDQENRAKIASMSPGEIGEERRELMNNFSPAFIQRLLQKSNIENGSTETRAFPSEADLGKEGSSAPDRTTKTVTFEEVTETDADHEIIEQFETQAALNLDMPPHDSVHFPRPIQPPALDPASETFLEDLHQKYFPSLPSDPDKLEWMQPSSKSGRDSYSPASSAFNAKDIRFDFRGELLPPKTASEIPVTAGLHHHGDAPDAAGYTIAELAHLARSSFAAQRCVAFQTLGRILYRLGKGEFGDPGEPGADVTGIDDSFGDLARGLWWQVEHLQVLKILVDESEGRGVGGGRHMSAKAYATEAVWLWNKGGGRRWKAA